MVAAIWIFTLTGLALWSLMAWGFYAVLNLAPGWAGELGPWLERLPMADWLESWLPGWQGLAEAVLHLMQALLSLLGTLMGTLAPWLVWGVWGVGALMMLALAMILHAIVRATQRPAAPVPVH